MLSRSATCHPWHGRAIGRRSRGQGKMWLRQAAGREACRRSRRQIPRWLSLSVRGDPCRQSKGEIPMWLTAVKVIVPVSEILLSSCTACGCSSPRAALRTTTKRSWRCLRSLLPVWSPSLTGTVSSSGVGRRPLTSPTQKWFRVLSSGTQSRSCLSNTSRPC